MTLAGPRHMPQIVSRRNLLAASAATAITLLPVREGSATQPVPDSGGIIVASPSATASLALVDPATGDSRFSFDVGPRPDAAWSTPLPGAALVRSETSLSIVNSNDGSVLPVAVPETVLPDILVSSIQFRGSDGQNKMLIGTPNFDADTWVVDLTTGERLAVIGLLLATQPPVSLQNVAISADDRWLLVWDGRTTWIVDLPNRTSRTLAVPSVTLQAGGEFTFSAGFSSEGDMLVYSRQLLDGSTELRLQSSDGTYDHQLLASAAILVSLWLPGRDLLLLDERSMDGGTLAVIDPETGNREDLLAYQGATNIVQFTPDGRQALVAIEGETGRDWYRIELSLVEPAAQLLAGLAEAVVHPGFEFASQWALALPSTEPEWTTSVKSVDLTAGVVTLLIGGLTSDAAITGPILASSGNAALIEIDSFTELAVHYLRLDEGRDIAIDMMKGGGGVIAPDGSAFAVSFDLNTGGTATIVYDELGNESTTMQGEALIWI